MNRSRSTKPLSGRRVAAIALRAFAHARETGFPVGNGSRILLESKARQTSRLKYAVLAPRAS